MPRTYTCAACGGTFLDGWTEAKAREEARREFGDVYYSQTMEVVCDDCYRLMKALMSPRAWRGLADA